MEANVYISKLKADGSKNDCTKLDEAFIEYKNILANLASKDRGIFSLNVLCILCRNLEKVPSWGTRVDNNDLLTLTIECFRQAQCVSTSDKVKMLACIYHIHRHAVRQNCPISPELILNVSYLPFEEDLLTDYCKTYWNLLADRIAYIEKKKTKLAITKLLPKLTEDIIKVIRIYNSVQFCGTVLNFLTKKLYYLFNESNAVELNKVFGLMFEEISMKNDLKCFKKLKDNEMLDVYVKLNDCLHVVAENSSKANFVQSTLNKIVQTCVAIVGHCPDLLHCLQTVYLNGFCNLFTSEPNVTFIETILNNFSNACGATEKLGYTKAMTATYPYVNQCLRLFVENSQHYSEETKLASLKLMQFLLGKLKNCEQILKCENCSVKTGLHDALRLSFLAKNFIPKDNLSVQMLPVYLSIVTQQYVILKELCVMGCKNYEKCYKKLQSDVHNTAINLNKLQSYEFSVKLFEIYLRNEILHFKSENDMKNISRALYNKGICQLDAKDYENALSDAYLSLVFSYPEGLSTEKYMSLVMDIKAKVFKNKDEENGDESKIEELQMMTVLDVCAVAYDESKYGNLRPFFCDLKFSELLKHEFEMYIRLWPSILPVAGVWRTLHDLTQHDIPWSTAKDEDIEQTLREVMLATPAAVRSIQNQHCSDVVSDMVEAFRIAPPRTTELKIFHVTLLLLKSEFQLNEASQKYGWKATESNMDPDQMQAYRTLSQEHEAARHAVEAVYLWTEIIEKIGEVPITPNIRLALHIARMFVPLLLHLYRTEHGLQLAYVCCVLAEHLDDKETYLRNAGTIVYYANQQTEGLTNLIAAGSKYCSEMIKVEDTLDSALTFLCDCAIFYSKIGSTNMSAKLVQTVQAKILNALAKDSKCNLDLSTGRLLEALAHIKPSAGPSALTAVNAAHRHYLTVPNAATKHTLRRYLAYTLKLHIVRAGLHSGSTAHSLLLWRRARAAGGATLPAAGGAAQGVIYALVCNCHLTDDAQVKIDNRLKYILGLQPLSEQPLTLQQDSKRHQIPSQRLDLETMLENMTFRTQTSPTICASIPRFKTPEFLTHKHCDCYACANNYSVILACKTLGLEASMHFRAQKFGVAREYFDGALDSCVLAKERLKINKVDNYKGFVVDIVQDILFEDFKKVEIEILIEAAFCELAQSNFKTTDEYVVRIHEILQDNVRVGPYMKNEVLNLMVATANIKNAAHKKVVDNLEPEFENLKLSPAKTEAKTPEHKAPAPPKITKIVVKEEEIHNTKRKVIKLNFDEKDEVENTKRASKRTQFKIPVPVTVKPELESITPTPRRIPKILVTQPTLDEDDVSFATPQAKSPALRRKKPIPSQSVGKPSTSSATPNAKANSSEFFTPVATPTEQFFTPMTSVKTYTKKTLRHGIVKNLESEFSTPESVKKEDKSNSPQLIEKPESLLKKCVLKGPAKSIPSSSKCVTNVTEKSKPNKSESNAKNADKSSRSRPKVETGTLKSIKDKRMLKRATSPGKLEKVEKKSTRSSRLRQPVRLSVDESDS